MSNVSGLAVGGCMLITLGKACSNTPAPAEWVIDVLSFFSVAYVSLCESGSRLHLLGETYTSSFFVQLSLWWQHARGLQQGSSWTCG